VYVHSGVVNQKIGFHTTGNSTSLSALGPILKIFWREPMSVGAKVILLVGYDETLHDLIEFGNS
jgi:hypothetical protein